MVALTVNQAELEMGRPARIISGFRTDVEQIALGRAGRPAVHPSISNHTVCPARAVDISLGLGPTRAMKATLGRIGVFNGLRWGGGSPVDTGGLPSDWQHFDLGPRHT